MKFVCWNTFEGVLQGLSVEREKELHRSFAATIKSSIIGRKETVAASPRIFDLVFHMDEAGMAKEATEAAYYDPRGTSGGDNYWLYSTQSDSAPVAEPPPGGPNSVHYNSVPSIPASWDFPLFARDSLFQAEADLKKGPISLAR